MTVDRNRRHHAEPRQQVNAPMALSLRDDPMKARPLTELAGPMTIVALRPSTPRTRRPAGPRFRRGADATRNSSCSGAEHNLLPCYGERSHMVWDPQRSCVGNLPPLRISVCPVRHQD